MNGGGESGPTRRALLVGVQKYLDAGLPARPGTCAALRMLAERLGDPARGGWTVQSLLDDEPAEDARPLLANLLARLDHLRGADEALLVLSGVVRDGYFLPRDGRPNMLARTALPLLEIAAHLPARAALILDAAAAPGQLVEVPWVLAAADADAPVTSTPPDGRGPSPFLRAVLRGVSGEAAPEGAVTADGLGHHVTTSSAVGKVGAWCRGTSDLVLLQEAELARACPRCDEPLVDPAAAFCPACGAPLHAPETLEGGRYRLLRPLGAGGMGQVFLAEDTRLHVQRALKLLSIPANVPPDEHESLRARMIEEARAAQALGERTHHVVRVFDVGYSPERGEPFLVMELLEGRTLTKRLEQTQMSMATALNLALTIADTLAIAHAEGMIHRDLKPDNVMLVRRGPEEREFVKLLDFGLVKMVEAEVKTQSGRLMGTLQYMAPEQLRASGVDARADVFSLAAVLYECLSGVRAVPGRTQGELFSVLLDKGVRSLGEVAPHVPADLVALVDRALSLDASRRPAHAGEFAAALRALGHHLGAQATAETMAAVAPAPTPGPTPSLARGEVSQVPTVAPRRRGRAPALVGLAALAVAGGAAFWLSRGPAPGPTGVDAGAAVARPKPAAPASGPTTAATPPSAVAPAPVTAAPPAPAPARESTFTPPAGPLPDETAATLSVEGDRVVARGADATARWVALVQAAALASAPPPAPDAEAAERWRRAAPRLRAWLAAGVPVDAVRATPDALSLPVAALEAARAARPERRPLPGVGTLLAQGDREPAFERGACPRIAEGDRVVTASWSTPGYGGGRCAGATCVGALARGLQTARAAGETTQVWMVVAREGAGEASSERVEIRCRVGPGGGGPR